MGDRIGSPSSMPEPGKLTKP